MVINLAVTDPTTELFAVLVPVFFFVGYFLNRVILTAVASRESATKFGFFKSLGSVLSFWSYNTILES